MSNTKTYSGVTGQEAQGFYQKALASGFTSKPAEVDFGYNQDFELSGHDIWFAVQWRLIEKEVIIAVTDKPFFITDDEIFAQLDGYVVEAKAGNLKPNMTIWGNAKKAEPEPVAEPRKTFWDNYTGQKLWSKD